MTKDVFINEKELLYRLECLVRWDGSITVPESPILSCAESTARWLIAERFDGRTPTSGETREVFETNWKETAYFQTRDSIPPDEFGLRVREGLRASRRLSDIVLRCEVLQTVSPYELTVGSSGIKGEYAVLRSSRRKKHAFALYLRHQGVRMKPLVPDIVSFARRLDLGNRWTESANRQWGIESIGVMHYWVSRDYAAEHRPDRQFATEMVEGALGAVTSGAFPRSGDHCLSCPTRACRPDDLVRPANIVVTSSLLHRLAAPPAQPGVAAARDPEEQFLAPIPEGRALGWNR